MLNDSLIAGIKDAIAAGLKRRTLTSCSRWSEACVVMGGKDFPGPIRWNYHPWLKDMHDSNAEWNVGQKSAQMGFTVVGMNRTFYKIDVERVSALYLLPTKTPDATDFSATRFDPTLELSPHLGKLFSDVKNVATKRAGSAVLYIRGANSRSGLKSIPVAFIVFDEYEEMNQENIPLAIERTSGQLSKQFWAISTPMVPGMGINKLFLGTTMEHFCFICPMCSRRTELIYPESLVICGESLDDPDLYLSHVICKECKRALPTDIRDKKDEAKAAYLRTGIWTPQGHNDFQNRGFYINQMYSPTILPSDLAKSYFRSLSDPAAEQEFHNSKMGNPHVVDGARVTDEEIQRAIGDYLKSDLTPEGALITMGVDVGKWLHCTVDQWFPKRMGSDLNMMSNCKTLCEQKVASFEELDGLMRRWQIMMCVIDANPERRKAFEFAIRFRGHVKLCFYGKGLSGKMISADKDDGEHTIKVDRTAWLDTALSRFHNDTIKLPKDVSREYQDHIKALIRVYEKDPDGNPIGRYLNQGDDHFGHSRNYSEIALPLAASLATNKDIASFM